MSDYSRTTRENRTSPMSSFVRWLRLKKYQYEVTFSLYMLTPTERFIFNFILFMLISLLVTAAYYYLPNHILIIYNRVWYYLQGELASKTAAAGAANKSTYITDGLRTTAAALKTASVESSTGALKEL
ncbi:hypothetical protein LTR99_001030 [Exophiala xenobiotica]|uniref:ATP synthase F0 subunit 8 n=1 Tax=Vermiconidia calcicola TaxID=1690605 RepID=A0AAV9QKD1_9PEZI|nr:hypothetical protein H2202_002250 [Exophiala xenobiotica]KAK5534836.1 hypothetical protein LTR23_008632 [Chaetothyriales sp. CCFEE 6169]KAK5545593.1 hypothetical protein LTR25_000600 [Vermiconidia calcicola]KAK5198991.1 hypothetical protein LTR92_001462 [Exophiala xenobiotica]KAK5208511.1 hypothetical protein LTR41_005737 [Exophiala xenobiotica]